MLKLLFVIVSVSAKLSSPLAPDSPDCPKLRTACANFYQTRNTLLGSLGPTIEMMNKFAYAIVQRSDADFFTRQSKEFDKLKNPPKRDCERGIITPLEFEGDVSSIASIRGNLVEVISKMKSILGQLPSTQQEKLNATPAIDVVKAFEQFPKQKEVLQIKDLATCAAKGDTKLK